MNGKGDIDRTADRPRYGRNYGKINWFRPMLDRLTPEQKKQMRASLKELRWRRKQREEL